jgi:hypothetical protein
MLVTLSRRGIFGLGLGLSLLSISACDEPECPSELAVLFATPGPGVLVSFADDVAETPGIQIDVRALSNLRRGDAASLLVIGPSGPAVMEDTKVGIGGEIVFESVTVPPGLLSFEIVATSSQCGAVSDRLDSLVVPEAACEVTITNGTVELPAFGIPVLNSSVDGDPIASGFQANIEVSSSPGLEVVLTLVDEDDDIEFNIGPVEVPAEGVVVFETDLAQGRQTIRARCSIDSVGSDSSPETYFVDTVIPICTLDSPLGPITPLLDEDGDSNNGIQLTMQGSADGAGDDDVFGQATSFFVDGVERAGSTVDTAGLAIGAGEFTSPGDAMIGFSVADRAGNLCTAENTVTVDIEGCAIMLEAPLDTVTIDANFGLPGLQVDVLVSVDPSCAGQDVVASCGGGATETLPSNGRATLQVTVDGSADAEGSELCNATVIDQSGIPTSVPILLAWDTRPPTCSLSFVAPALACIETVSGTADVDPLANGVQIDVRVDSSGGAADTREVELINSLGMMLIATDSAGDARITLEPGLNEVQAHAVDPAGNPCVEPIPACRISLSQIVVGFSPPIDDGQIFRSDCKPFNNCNRVGAEHRGRPNGGGYSVR